MTQSDSTVSYNTIQFLLETNKLIQKGIHISCKCSQNKSVEPFTMILPKDDIKGIAFKSNDDTGHYILTTTGIYIEPTNLVDIEHSYIKISTILVSEYNFVSSIILPFYIYLFIIILYFDNHQIFPLL